VGEAHDPVAELDALIGRASTAGLGWADAHRAVDLLDFVPGRARAVARALDDRLDAAHLDALWRLPPALPGVVEGTYRGLRLGLRRSWPAAEDAPGFTAPRCLALEFPRSRARRFPELLARAQALPQRDVESGQLLALEVAGRRRYRLELGRAPAAPADDELRWLHSALARIKGVRLWFNGWPVDADGPWPLRTRELLVDAWLEAPPPAPPC